ncbi:MAG: YHYH protein [Rubrobacteraceae bacterium]
MKTEEERGRQRWLKGGRLILVSGLAAILALGLACSSTDNDGGKSEANGGRSVADGSKTEAEGATTTATAEAGGAPTTPSPAAEPLFTFPTTLTGARFGESLEGTGRGALWFCGGGSLRDLERPWVSDNGRDIDLRARPTVPGAVFWDSELAVSLQDDGRRIVGNGLPDHATGIFPPPEQSAIYRYYKELGGEKAGLVESDFDVTLPNESEPGEPACTPLGPIGIALTGGFIFNALDANNSDANVALGFDSCLGHPSPFGNYHYHQPSPCFEIGDPSAHSPLIGWAADGFGIYGPRGEDGEVMTNADLDECHGHTGPVPGREEGQQSTVYHYHANYEYPYIVGCFRGEDVRILAPPPTPPGMGPGGGTPGTGTAPGGDQPAVADEFGHLYTPQGIVHTEDHHAHGGGHDPHTHDEHDPIPNESSNRP